jgi:hypothetical protein
MKGCEGVFLSLAEFNGFDPKKCFGVLKQHCSVGSSKPVSAGPDSLLDSMGNMLQSTLRKPNFKFKEEGRLT